MLENLQNVTKQEGEDCGDCFNPSINNFCGECAVGLECRYNPTLPYAGTCEKRTGRNMTYNFAGINLKSSCM